MEIARLWFDFTGRVNRAKYWLVTIANTLIMAALVFMAIIEKSWTLGILAGLVWCVVTVSGFAIAVKRLHDRNKSAWWLLIFYGLPFLAGSTAATWHEIGWALHLVSVVVTFWVVIELGCLEGTPGKNDYGNNPLPQI